MEKFDFVNNGEDLTHIRKQLNLTEEYFAEKCGVSRQTISGFENGNKVRKTLLIVINFVIKYYLEDNNLSIDSNGKIIERIKL